MRYSPTDGCGEHLVEDAEVLALDDVVEGAILHRDVHAFNVGDNGHSAVPHELMVTLGGCKTRLHRRRVARKIVGEAAACVATAELDPLHASDVIRVFFLPRLAMPCCPKSRRKQLMPMDGMSKRAVLRVDDVVLLQVVHEHASALPPQDRDHVLREVPA